MKKLFHQYAPISSHHITFDGKGLPAFYLKTNAAKCKNLWVLRGAVKELKLVLIYCPDENFGLSLPNFISMQLKSPTPESYLEN